MTFQDYKSMDCTVSRMSTNFLLLLLSSLYNFNFCTGQILLLFLLLLLGCCHLVRRVLLARVDG